MSDNHPLQQLGQCELLAEVVTLRGRGTMVIPAAMRRELGLEEGSTLLLLVEEGELRVRPVPEDPLERLAAAITAGYGDVRPEVALRELREEWPD
jgi:AbrB family looped-hinge helix DNA binding protein